MEIPNELNVYKGAESLSKYFDPNFQPPLPLVEIPKNLNPFYDDKVRIYAKMMTMLPAQNVKALPALNMLEKEFASSKPRTIIEPSSGSTVISLSLVSRALYQNPDVCALVSNKTEKSRLRTLQFFGLRVQLYGGPSQPEITDPRGAIAKIKQIAMQDDCIFNPGQYENEANPASHVRWTGPQLAKQIPEINIFCAGMGSAGCITGTGKYLKEFKPDVAVIGVCNKYGDPIPGPRPSQLFESIEFPWKQYVDGIEEVASPESYRLSMHLSREGLICGPSSGMALQGLFSFLERAKNEDRLSQYAEGKGKVISCVFLCCDLPYQYMDNYFDKLSTEDFHPIVNEKLLNIDTYGYDIRWELDRDTATKMLYGEVVDAGFHDLCETNPCYCDTHGPLNGCNRGIVIDLRSSCDYKCSHFSGARNIPLHSLTASTDSPFDKVSILEDQWTELNQTLNGTFCSSTLLLGRVVIIVCYIGETARLASSILRAQGISAYSLREGMSAILKNKNAGEVQRTDTVREMNGH